MVKLLRDWPRRSPLLQVALFALFGLFCFELAKELLVPELSKWQSHLLTIGFGALVAVGAGGRRARPA
jgi:hypothetical protein